MWLNVSNVDTAARMVPYRSSCNMSCRKSRMRPVRPSSSAFSRSTLSISSDWSMPITSYPAWASISVSSPVPQPKSASSPPVTPQAASSPVT